MSKSGSRKRRFLRLAGIVSPRLRPAVMMAAGIAANAICSRSAQAFHNGAPDTYYLRTLEDPSPPDDWEYHRSVTGIDGDIDIYNWATNPSEVYSTVTDPYFSSHSFNYPSSAGDVAIVEDKDAENQFKNRSGITLLNLNSTVAVAGLSMLTDNNNMSYSIVTNSNGGNLVMDSGVVGTNAYISTGAENSAIDSGKNKITAPVKLNSTTDISGTSLTISGPISGTGGLTCNMSGSLLLSYVGGNNTYSGGTTIYGGTLSVAADTDLGTGPLIFNPTGNTPAIFNTSDTGIVRPIVMTGAGTINCNSTLGATVCTQVISGSGLLTKGGVSTMILQAVNTMTGGLNITAGKVQFFPAGTLGNGGQITIASGATLDLSGTNQTVDGINGTGSITCSLGTGTLTVGRNETASSFGGTISGTITLAVTSAGILTLSSGNTYTGGTSVNNAGLITTANNALGTGSMLLANGAIWNCVASQTITTLNGDSTTFISGEAGGGTLVIGSTTTPQNGSFAGVIREDAGPIGITKIGLATQVLSGASNNYSGNTNISGGALQATDGIGLPNSSNLILNGGVTQPDNVATTFSRSLGTAAGQVQFGINGGGFSAHGGTFTVEIGGASAIGTPLVWGSTTNFLPGSAPLLFGSSTANGMTDFQNAIDLGGGARTVSVTAGTGGDYAQLSGAISSPGGGGALIKAGNGTLVLAGSNTYSAGTTINNGILKINSIANLGSASSPLTINVGTLQFGAAFDPTGSRTITLASAVSSIDTNNNNVTISAAMGGSGALNKVGPGTLTLTGLNTYTGATYIGQGGLTLGANNTLPAGTNVTVAAGAIFNVNNFTQTINSLTGGIIDGNVLLSSGHLKITEPNASSPGVTPGPNPPLASGATFSGSISGSGSLEFDNSGIQALTGTSNFTGGTILGGSGGGVSISADANLGVATSPITFNPIVVGYQPVLYTTATFATIHPIQLGTANPNFANHINVADSTTFTVNSVISNSPTTTRQPPLQKDGTGTLVLNSVNTWGTNDGDVYLYDNAGTVQLGINNAIPDVEVGFLSAYPTKSILDLNGFKDTIAGLTGGYSGGTQLGTVTNSSATPAVLTLNSNYSPEYDGNITGNLSIIVTNTQAFGSPNSNCGSNYSGGTSVLAGTFKLGYASTQNGNGTIATGPIGTGPLTVGASNGSSNAIITLNSITLYNPITIVSGNTGKLLLNGSNIYSTPVFAGAITLQKDVTLTGNAQFSGVISGIGNISIDNAGLSTDGGTTTLSGVNTYAGSTTIGTGALMMGIANALPSTTAVIITGLGTGNGFNINNFNTTIGSLTEAAGGDASHGAVTLGSAALTTGTDNTSTKFAGQIIGSGGLIKVGSGVFTLAGTNTYTGATTVNGGKLVLASGASLASKTIQVNSGALMAVSGNLSTGVAINLNGAADFGAGYTLTGITALAAQGFGGGNWNGSGIASSLAGSDSQHLTAVGVIQNNALGTAIYNSSNPFHGYVPLAADILVTRTAYGDANLNGTVDGSDYSLIDNGYLQKATGWFNGDFNYDGVVNGSDYTLIDNAFNRQSTVISTEIAEPTAQLSNSPISSVPEPASDALMIGLFGLLGRRARRLCAK